MGSRLYIGQLSYNVRERDVEKFFKGYGRIREVLLKNGYGFVEFDDNRDAEDAVYELNGKQLCGERVVIEHARNGPSRGGASFGGGYGGRRSWNDNYGGGGRGGGGRGYYGNNSRSGPPTRTSHRLIVENLSSRVSWQNLKDYMRQAGEVVYADAHKRHQNEGVVEFQSYSDMKKALDRLDNTDLNGRKIRLSEDKPRRSSRRSRSRSDSRSRSRSRSRQRSRSKRSRSRSKNHSRSKSKSASPKSKSASRSHSKSKSRSRSRSASPAPKREKEASKSPEKD